MGAIDVDQHDRRGLGAPRPAVARLRIGFAVRGRSSNGLGLLVRWTRWPVFRTITQLAYTVFAKNRLIFRRTECKDGSCTTNANDLFGDFVVVNPLQGTAYSSGICQMWIRPSLPTEANCEPSGDHSVL